MTKLPPRIAALHAPRRTAELTEGWQVGPTAKGPWQPARVPGAVAAGSGEHWYQVEFPAPACSDATRVYLRFDGLATIAEVRLNGTPIIESRNMFRGHRVEVTALLRDTNHLGIVFRSLDPELAKRRPRPRWKTALVAEQNLRYVRTSLMGRIAGWTPPVVAAGPWGGVALECTDRIDVEIEDLQAHACDGGGHVLFRARATPAPEGARLRLGETTVTLAVGADGAIHGEARLDDAPLWWPHTHGTPALLPCTLELRVGGAWIPIDCGRIGFRCVEVDQDSGQVRFQVNGVEVFCRGACWTPLDAAALHAEPKRLRASLTALRDAGANMLRVGGTMAYESDAFYELCDELGLMVWQDFMFANMDYPVADPEFRREIEAEARYQLGRLARHACIAVYCGGSEIAQQPAMMGLPAEAWSNEFFTEWLPNECARRHAGTTYFPTTPWGGTLPIHVGSGLSHYYGVGAYRRPLCEVKSAGVKFATECLGFANVPDAPARELLTAPVPRDSGSGYDFEDVRDHYTRELFALDPVALRSQDPERYYAVSRVTTGEVMGRVYSEWRRPGSSCGGALVWFATDLEPGSGFGIVDSGGSPKAAFWYLRRAWAPRTLRLTDEGLDGVAIHVLNERDEPFDARVELQLMDDGQCIAQADPAEVSVPARGAVTLEGDALLGRFTDATNAYRFGPAKYDVIAARLVDPASGETIAEDFLFPAGYELPQQRPTVSAAARGKIDGTVVVRLKSDAFLQAVAIDCRGFAPDDNYFHLVPGREKRIVFTPGEGAGEAFTAHFEALNARGTCTARTTRPG